MQTVSIYKDHDLGIYIAKMVLLLLAPSVILSSSTSVAWQFPYARDLGLTLSQQTRLLTYQLLHSGPGPLLRPLSLTHPPRSRNNHLRWPRRCHRYRNR